MTGPSAAPARLGAPSGRWVVLATVLGSGMVLLDTTAVNVALPTIGRELGASLSGLQWIMSGYTLALAALILLGGSLGDRIGRRRIFVTGVIWFALASAVCGLAPPAGAGFSALAAGSALLPVTAAMIVLSPWSAALAQRIGPRWPLTAGAATCAAGLLLALRIGVGASYLRDVLPAVAVFGVGIALIVSPLTATVLASADVRNAGIASGVSNAVTRVAGLIGVAALPAVVGLRAAAFRSPGMLTSGFHLAMIVCAGLLALAALLAVTLIDDRVLQAVPKPWRSETISARRR